MLVYGILSALNSPAPSQTDLVEVRRYLQALAQWHMHMFDVLVRLASGPLLARCDAYLDKCALAASVKSSLRVQPIESATLFGPKMPEVAKTYKEDLTRRSLQNAAVAHLPAKRQALPLILRIRVIRSSRELEVKNRDARFFQACQDSSESLGSDKYSLPKPHIPTGGRLYHFRKVWKNISTDKWTQSVIRNGYRIQFRVRPKLQ